MSASPTSTYTTPPPKKIVQSDYRRGSVVTLAKIHTHEAGYRLRVMTPDKTIPITPLPPTTEELMVKHRTTAAYALAKARNVAYCAENKKPFVLKDFEAVYAQTLKERTKL